MPDDLTLKFNIYDIMFIYMYKASACWLVSLFVGTLHLIAYSSIAIILEY